MKNLLLRRIHIAGPYGSGKSTFAKKLSKILKIPIYELDELKYNRKNNTERNEKEMNSILKKIVLKKEWIIEGAWSDRARDSFRRADIVIILNPPRRTLIYNHLKRIISRQKKFSLGFNIKLLRKSLNYSSMKKHPSFHTHFKEARKNKEYLVIKSKWEVKNFLNQFK